LLATLPTAHVEGPGEETTEGERALRAARAEIDAAFRLQPQLVPGTLDFVDAVTHWTSAKITAVAPNLSKVALILAFMPPSGAPIESAFSRLKWIVGARRARMTLAHIETMTLFSCNKDLAETAFGIVAR
jgi:hypothetical protein